MAQIRNGVVNWKGLSQHSFISFFTTVVRNKVLLHPGETIGQTEACCTSVCVASFRPKSEFLFGVWKVLGSFVL